MRPHLGRKMVSDTTPHTDTRTPQNSLALRLARVILVDISAAEFKRPIENPQVQTCRSSRVAHCCFFQFFTRHGSAPLTPQCVSSRRLRPNLVTTASANL